MRLDEASALLREHLGPGAEATSVVRGSVGNSQETYFVGARVDGAERELVVRRSAPAGVLDWTEREREHEVLRALAGRGLPVPAIYGSGTLERPYLLMERRPGSAPARLSEAQRASLADDLGQSLATLHRLDLGELGLEPVDLREATLSQVRRSQEHYRGAQAAPVPLLGALLAWCEHNVPEDGAAPVLLWGDPGPHNVLAQEGRISALLDWELTHVGHPLDDLGAAVWGCLEDIVDAEAVIAAYAAAAGPFPRSTLDYFIAMACATRAVMMLNGVHAWIEGRATSPLTAGLGLELFALTLARGASAAGWGELPPSDGQPPELPLRPDAAETAGGVASWLLGELLPAVDDRRLRRQLKTVAGLLETVALRGGAPPGRDLQAAEDEAVAAEAAGGDPAIRQALLLDLARERARLAPLVRLYHHRTELRWPTP